MHTFTYVKATTLRAAMAQAAAPDTLMIAGGTEVLNWMKEGIATPSRLLDINSIAELDFVEVNSQGARIGALARMSNVGGHEAIVRDYPVISQALLQGASPQLRNMASMGGNLLQRTRCPYFRAEIDLPCNKRRPGSGCSALDGADRSMALFGRDEKCIATHPSDVAVAFAALEAIVHVQGPGGARAIPFGEFYRFPGGEPERDTTLTPGELIISINIPATPFAQRSHYLKVRERTSFAPALVSVAVALDMNGTRIRGARIALGGLAPMPWRLSAAEEALIGISVSDEAAIDRSLDSSLADAKPGRSNGFKIELARRATRRALQTAGGIV
jgi:xanthine dehydrogenase YagS FAD-binding subunit